MNWSELCQYRVISDCSKAWVVMQLALLTLVHMALGLNPNRDESSASSCMVFHSTECTKLTPSTPRYRGLDKEEYLMIILG